MIEKLDKRSVRRVFPRGALVAVAVSEARVETRLPRVAAVIVGWSGAVCTVVMRRSLQIPLPASGAQVELLAVRPDGIYRLPARVEALTIAWSSGQGAERCTLELRPELHRAAREQDRRFYRLAGCWSARMSPADAVGDGQAAEGRPTQVSSLSAGGVLIDDPGDELQAGRRFRLSLDLNDGGPLLEITAEAVRRDTAARVFTGRWGCRFIDLPREPEARIARLLEARLRARLAGPAARAPAPAAAQSA